MTTATARIQFMDNVEKAKREGRTEGSVNAQPNLSHLGKRIAAASIGAVLTSLLMTPFDVVKTRIQSTEMQLATTRDRYVFKMDADVLGTTSNRCNRNSRLSVSGTWAGFRKISATEGFTGLWRGLTPTLVMSVPSTVIYYVSYEQIRASFSLLYTNDVYAPLTAGALARVLSATAISPLELVRTRMQAGDKSLSQVIGGVSKLVASNGVSTLWRGLMPTLWRDVPFSALYWMSYESIKPQILANEYVALLRSDFMASFTAGCVAGMASAVVTHPFDVVKTIQQVAHASNTQQNMRMLSVLTSVYFQSGIRGLFVGLTPRIAKVAPACGIMISTYEMGKQLLN